MKICLDAGHYGNYKGRYCMSKEVVIRSLPAAVALEV